MVMARATRTSPARLNRPSLHDAAASLLARRRRPAARARAEAPPVRLSLLIPRRGCVVVAAVSIAPSRQLPLLWRSQQAAASQAGVVRACLGTARRRRHTPAVARAKKRGGDHAEKKSGMICTLISLIFSRAAQMASKPGRTTGIGSLRRSKKGGRTSGAALAPLGGNRACC